MNLKTKNNNNTVYSHANQRQRQDEKERHPFAPVTCKDDRYRRYNTVTNYEYITVLQTVTTQF